MGCFLLRTLIVWYNQGAAWERRGSGVRALQTLDAHGAEENGWART